jgi:hypothetical protein
MRVLMACKSFVSQLARWLDATRRDSVYMPQHVGPHAQTDISSCAECNPPEIDLDGLSELELRYLWGDR